MGLRDDAAFWFYAAKDRYVTLADVHRHECRRPCRQVEDAIKSFIALAGPVINGYAFCDIDNQAAIRAKAIDWVEANPYRRDPDGPPAGEGERPDGRARRFDRCGSGTGAAKETRLPRGRDQPRDVHRDARRQRDGPAFLLEVVAVTRRGRRGARGAGIRAR